MVFPLLGEIEKLINERGSAAIMKERLSHAADQYSALEKKIVDAESRAESSERRASKFESENKSLRLNIQKAEEKIRDLEENLVGGHSKTLEEGEVKIMLHISKENSCLASDISKSLGHGEAIIEFHLEELKTKGMVSVEYIAMLGEMWSLEQPGRKHLIQNNLIK
jgi:chromosome segregation ATPase